MAEATVETNETIDPAQAAALEAAARKIEVARIKQIGSFHIALVSGALTLWGAAVTWAEVTGWAIAHFTAVVNALVAGFVLPSTFHEWGHFLGARLSGAKSPVLEEPKRHFFMFDFPMAENDLRQFTWMSWGGILAPWAVALVAVLVVPLSTFSGIVLLSTLLARAVATSVFEVPVVQGAQRTGEPGAALGKQLAAGGLDQGRNVGTAVGFAVAALLWLVF